MPDYGGWAGKVLRVDLSTGKISAEDTIEKYKAFIGGSGLGYKVLWDEVPPGTKAWDPENRLIFSIGPLTGTGAPLASRTTTTSLGPVNYMELPTSGHMGGHWGAELKFAGWDGIILQGKASHPVWLYINDDKVEIRDARRLWGNGIFRTTSDICLEMGSDAHVAAIGQAGENLVRMSCIMCDRSHSAGGHGSVMGSKNLKAIGVKGSGGLKIAADRKEWKDLVYYYLSLIGANSGGVVPSTPQPWAEYSGRTRWTARKGLYWGAAHPPLETGECSASDLNRMGFRTHKGIMDHGEGPGERHTVRMGGCHSCPIRCHVMTDVPALEKYGVSRYQSNTCVGNGHGTGFFPNLGRGTENSIECSQLGVALADDYGIWNDYNLYISDFKYCYEKGIFKERLDSEEYDSIPWALMENSDPAFLLDIMKRIAFKEGELGEILADGPVLLETRWPDMAEAHNSERSLGCWKWGHRFHHSNESSGQVGSLINCVYNRDPMCHTHSNFLGSGLPLDLMKDIGAEIFGTPDAVDMSRNYTPMNEGKAVFAKLSLIYMELHNSLTLCNYTLPTWCSPLKSRKYRGDLDMEAKIYSAVTGDKVTRQEIEDTGLRILTLFRALTARYMNEKDQRNKHDLINDWVFDQPPDQKPFTPGSQKMDRDDMEVAKNLFYEQLGWDVATGMPTRSTLMRLGLEDVAEDLAGRGLLP
ncbi:aldehyde ferredoxin oxidoreductase [Deltaproteobacteria bacterium]|nr:aldehyde ferredoxin oxidoreductase [Deltaproteobacteria bacterium]